MLRAEGPCPKCPGKLLPLEGTVGGKPVTVFVCPECRGSFDEVGASVVWDDPNHPVAKLIRGEGNRRQRRAREARGRAAR